MSRYVLTALFLLVAASGAAHAQSDGEDPGRMRQQNSAHCGYTFFTNKADTLDFQGAEDRRCFDMKGGDDVLILNREIFPAGVEIWTGTGRDTVWATDGPDLVVDADGEDAEIRTYDGDDRIEIRLPVDESPSYSSAPTGRTILRPGRGENRIEIGKDIASNAVARRPADIWLTSDEEARDVIDATCGRPTLTGDFDIRAVEVPETSRVEIAADGCNVGLFGLYGDADVRMMGGRLAVQSTSSGFRIAKGENTPRITGDIRGGLALMLDMDRVDPASTLFWEGKGAAFIRARMARREDGGRFEVRSGSEVHFQGEVPVGPAEFDLAARERVILDLGGAGRESRARFALAAARMDVSWRLTDSAVFPEIVNDETVRYLDTTFVLPEIDFKADRASSPLALASSSIIEPDEVVTQSLFEDVSDVEIARSDVVIVPGSTRLRLQLRRANDAKAQCVSVRVIDAQGARPERGAVCPGRTAPVETLMIDDASDYEAIVITGAGLHLTIPINEGARFKVDRIEIEL